MMWLLNLPFDQNPIIINHQSNGDLIATLFLDGFKMNTRRTCSITRQQDHVGKSNFYAHVLFTYTTNLWDLTGFLLITIKEHRCI